MMKEKCQVSGIVERIIEWDDGTKEVIEIHNTILVAGRKALAKCLANFIGDTFEFFITKKIGRAHV